MLEPAARDDVAGGGERLDDGLVGIALLALVVDDALAFEAGGMRGERAVLIDGVRNGGIDVARSQCARIGGPDFEVLAAVARCGVDEAGAGVIGDVIAGEEGHIEIVAAHALQRMSGDQGLKNRCRHRVDFLVGSNARLLENIGGELVRKDQGIAGLRPIVCRCVGYAIDAVGDFG